MQSFKIINGDCRFEMALNLEPESVDAIVCDPPYGLSFMGANWDRGVPGKAFWEQALRVLKPGGQLIAFSGSRTYHRLAVAIEDAGFEIRDQILWLYGSGFPKSLDLGKAIDKVDAADMRRARQLRFTEWMRGTGLTSARIDELTGTNMGGHYTTAASQPAVATRDHLEALRPHIATVPDWVEAMVDERTVESENYKRREKVGEQVVNGEEGTAGGYKNGIASVAGADISAKRTIDITAPATDAAKQWEGWGTALKPAHEPAVLARKPLSKGKTVAQNVLAHGTGALNINACRVDGSLAAGETNLGRWPANLMHDGTPEVEALFPGDSARFFYCPKASKKDRNEGLDAFPDKKVEADHGGLGRACSVEKRVAGDGVNAATAKNTHPTVKPTELMAYLCRLITPPGGLVLDPFMGSGSTGKAALREGFSFIGIDLDAGYCKIAEARVQREADKLAKAAKPAAEPVEGKAEELPPLDYSGEEMTHEQAAAITAAFAHRLAISGPVAEGEQ